MQQIADIASEIIGDKIKVRAIPTRMVNALPVVAGLFMPGMKDMAQEGRSLTLAARTLLDTAGRLFYDRGIAAVGVDTIAAETGVTKKTMYDQFGSKAALVVAYLEERDLDFRQRVERTIADRAGTDRVLAVFDALEAWMADRSPQGCAFVHAHGELVGSPEHPAHEVIRAQKAWLRQLFEDLLVAEGHEDPLSGATRLVVLIEGATVLRSISEVPDAVTEARRVAELITSWLTEPRSIQE